VAEEAASERQRLLDEARKAGDDMRTKRQEVVREEAQNLHHAFIIRAQQEVVAIARKALTDLASAQLEDQLGEVFIRRLRTLDSTAKAVLATALAGTAGPALVRSAFALTADQRAHIQQALNETFARDLPLRFEAAAELVCGVEFVASGQKVSWSIADYLASLERGIDELADRTDPPQPLNGNRAKAVAVAAAASASAAAVPNGIPHKP
jgi:F-type H+-transporting ATPase subunit b